jgi:hypothetical protein
MQKKGERTLYPYRDDNIVMAQILSDEIRKQPDKCPVELAGFLSLKHNFPIVMMYYYLMEILPTYSSNLTGRIDKMVAISGQEVVCEYQ